MMALYMPQSRIAELASGALAGQAASLLGLNRKFIQYLVARGIISIFYFTSIADWISTQISVVTFGGRLIALEN